jgi:tol-pal system beta propeller repeat protein TolB
VKKGYFDTRVVYVAGIRPEADRKRQLAIMDQDGFNVRMLTNGKRPRADAALFAEQAGNHLHVVRGQQQPRVYLLQLETGQREVVGNFPGMTFAPRFSPDGQKVVMSLQQDGNANIYTMDLRSRTTTRLTSTAAIDTSPSYSPDGGRIVFESDRGGRQQLYVMSCRRWSNQNAHLLRRRFLFHAGLVAARRSDRLHQAVGRQVLDRRDEAGRLGRTHPDDRLPQRGSDLGTERPRHLMFFRMVSTA